MLTLLTVGAFSFRVTGLRGFIPVLIVACDPHCGERYRSRLLPTLEITSATSVGTK